MYLLFCPLGSHAPSLGADGESRARARDVFARKGGSCQTELHPHGDPAGGARAAVEQEHVGAQSGPDGECVTSWRYLYL